MMIQKRFRIKHDFTFKSLSMKAINCLNYDGNANARTMAFCSNTINLLSKNTQTCTRSQDTTRTHTPEQYTHTHASQTRKRKQATSNESINFNSLENAAVYLQNSSNVLYVAGNSSRSRIQVL